MKFKHRIISLAVTAFSIGTSVFNINVQAMETNYANKEKATINDSLKVVNTYIDSIDKRKWNELLKLIPANKKDFWSEFLSNKENETNNLGVLNVTSAKIKEITLIPEDEMRKIKSLDEYKLNYSNIESYLVGIDYKVKSENIHYFNGVSYEVFIIGWNNENPYVLAEIDAPLEKLVPAGFAFNSSDESKALNRIKEKYKGKYINSDGILLEENRDLKTTNSSESMTASNVYYRPISIKVYHIRSSSDPYYKQITTEDFSLYVQDVLGHEWRPAWHSQALKAGALAVKGYAWYERLHPDKTQLAVQMGADISDSYQYDQHYEKGYSNNLPTIQQACADMNYTALVDSDGNILYTEHVAGKENQSGVGGDGVMKQNGTQFCAVNYSWDYFKICSYYYNFSKHSPGGIYEVPLV